MENKICENKCGMTLDKRVIKPQGFSRALSIFNHYFGENTPNSLPILGDEITAHQAEQLNVERWQQRIAENLWHNNFR
jgi:hypothetical protein